MKNLFLSLIILLAIGNSAYSQNGSIDLTFSEDGQYGFMPLPNDVITSEIIEADGKIFAFLPSVNGGSDAFILKMNEDGSVDNLFGLSGMVTLEDMILYDAALSVDGQSIYIVSAIVGIVNLTELALDGSVIQPWTSLPAAYGSGFTKMAVDSEGRIYLGTGITIDNQGYGRVIRLNEDLQIDNDYGMSGAATTIEYGFQYPLLEIDHEDRAVLAHSGPGGSGVFRFNTDGSVDDTFDYNLNFQTYQLSNWILDIAIAPDDGVYVQPNCYAQPTKLFRLTPTGAVDYNFGISGVMDVNDNSENQFIVPDELLSEPEGGLILLASAFDAGANMSGKFLMRLDADGVVDPAFSSGIQPIDDNGYDLNINFHVATLQADGKVLSMDQVATWQNGQLLGYKPLITRFINEEGALPENVNDIATNPDFSFYPNPTSGMASLRLNGNGLSNASIIIYNAIGSEVMRQSVRNADIDLTTLAPGQYHAILQHDGGLLQMVVVKL